MQFNSYIFILFFLPAFILCYFVANKINALIGKIIILAFSIVFYVYGGWHSAIVLGISILVNYLLSILFSKITKHRKTILVVAVLMNIGLLFFFKYINFSISAINSIFGQSLSFIETFLPLGISFFTFQQLMFIVSVYRKEIVNIDLLDYLCYILFFPKVIMGPLMGPLEFIEQLNDSTIKKFNSENTAYGIKLFTFGLFKKMILADTFAKGVLWGFNNLDNITSGDLILVSLFYTFEIYFDFSGYSDMATGIAKMINIALPINFDSPYKAMSIRDFWKRWHMSLTNFFTKYVYFPLGGSKKGTLRTYLNILIVFIVSGIWHGANWTFILWGIIHGGIQILERIFEKPLNRQNGPIRYIYTFLMINLLWLLFRSESIIQWLSMMRKMFSFVDMSISDGLIKCFIVPETSFLFDTVDFLGLNSIIRGFPMLLITIISFLICTVPENNYRNMTKITIVNMILCAIAFVWAFLCLSSESTFVYYNF